jgi:hypothetical protein
MGPERHPESSHEGSRQKPKLSLAGRLDGHLDGRPVSLVAENRDLVLHAGRIRTLLTLRRSWKSTVQPLRAVLGRAEIPLMLRIGWFGKVEVFPNPIYLIRLLLPGT